METELTTDYTDCTDINLRRLRIIRLRKQEAPSTLVDTSLLFFIRENPWNPWFHFALLNEKMAAFSRTPLQPLASAPSA